MAKAIVPTEMPELPEAVNAWARSTKTAHGMYHAHTLGYALCGRLVLERHRSSPLRSLGDAQYFGLCPQCFKLSGETANG